MQAFAGIVSITGEPDRPGVRVGASLIDIGTGVWAALGIVAALLERRDTGRGRDVGVALFDTALSLVGYQLTAALASGVAPGRHGTAFPLIAPYEVFETADGGLMIAAANDGLFRLLCERIGLPELADDPRFATNPDRLAQSRRAAAADPRAAPRRRAPPTGSSALSGIPVAPVQDLVEVGAHPQTRESGMLGEVGGFESVLPPVRLDGERLGARRRAAAPRRALRRDPAPSSATATTRSRRCWNAVL